jgi:hypothetical protein
MPIVSATQFRWGLLLGPLTWLFTACSSPVEVAHYGSKKLTVDDVRAVVGAKALQGPDSAQVIKAYAQAWAEEMALAAVADKEVSDIENRIQPRVEETKRKLRIALLEEQVLATKLDTTVKTEDLEAFYRENAALFVTNEPLWQFNYIQTTQTEPADLRTALANGSPEALSNIRAWAKQNAKKAVLDGGWHTGTELDQVANYMGYPLRQLPAGSPLLALTTNVNNAQLTHYVYIRGTLVAGQALPLSAVTERVKQIVLNRRSLELLRQYRNSILQQARADGTID